MSVLSLFRYASSEDVRKGLMYESFFFTDNSILMTYSIKDLRMKFDNWKQCERAMVRMMCGLKLREK